MIINPNRFWWGIRVMLTIIAAIAYYMVVAQELEQCGFDYLNQTHREYPIQYDRDDELLTVPVVVHIIHRGEPIGIGSNISDEQVYSAINALNEDYRKVAGTNGDGGGVDTKIEFCLAVRDFDGNPHTGINRVDGTVVPLYEQEGITASSFGGGANEMAVKNLSRWPNTYAYNIWIVAEIDNNDGGGGIQGYAYFPTLNAVDGTVILYNAFGTVGTLKSYTNMNRTTTHELGHALNLYHTFQGSNCNETNCSSQGDRVCDTPPTTQNSNCLTPACSGTQQIENYMDYTSQVCKDMFTQGQKDRMRAALYGPRSPLLESLACTPVSPVNAVISEVAYPIGAICNNTVEPRIKIHNTGYSDLTNATINYHGCTYEWTGNLSTGQSEYIDLPECTLPDAGIFTATMNYAGGESSNTSEYYVVQDGHVAHLNITYDYYASETSWKIFDHNDELVALGYGTTNGEWGQQESFDICLPDGCYDFYLYDSYGDGICCTYGFGEFSLYVENVPVIVYTPFDDFTGTNIEFDEITADFCMVDLPLSVELVELDVQVEDSYDLIHWKTASETNSDYFILEISSDAKNWQQIATITAAGNSSTPINYSYINEQYLQGAYYYQLTEVDYNGNKDVFPITYAIREQQDCIYYDILGRKVTNLRPYQIYFKVSGDKVERILTNKTGVR